MTAHNPKKAAASIKSSLKCFDEAFRGSILEKMEVLKRPIRIAEKPVSPNTCASMLTPQRKCPTLARKEARMWRRGQHLVKSCVFLEMF